MALLAVGLMLAVSDSTAGQVKTTVPDVVPGAKPAAIERIKIHGAALDGNLEGNAVDRDVIVFLPPSYARERSRRFPVVYALHGYSIGAEQWSREIHVPQTIEGAFAKGAKEMIVVLPDSKTVHNGSMYSSSITTGDFENFIARDVVAYVDAHYRTIPNREQPRARRSLDGRVWREPRRHEARGRVRQPLHHEPVLPVAAGRGPRQSGERRSAGRGQDAGGFAETPLRSARPVCVSRSLVAESEESAALRGSADRTQRDVVLAKWAANAPLAFIDQYILNLRQYRAIAIDVGDQDGLRADASKLHDALDHYGVANTFEIYAGTHTSQVAVRFQEHVLPFFSRTLSFEQVKR